MTAIHLETNINKLIASPTLAQDFPNSTSFDVSPSFEAYHTIEPDSEKPDQMIRLNLYWEYSAPGFLECVIEAKYRLRYVDVEKPEEVASKIMMDALLRFQETCNDRAPNSVKLRKVIPITHIYTPGRILRFRDAISDDLKSLCVKKSD